MIVYENNKKAFVCKYVAAYIFCLVLPALLLTLGTLCAVFIIPCGIINYDSLDDSTDSDSDDDDNDN